MGEQRQECGERAESCGEEDEEWELLLGVDGHLVERRQQLTVGALGAAWVWVEEVSLLERVWDEPEGALPGAVEQVEGAVHPLPVLQVEERVRYRLRVAPLQHMLRRQDQRLHL